MSMDTFEFGDQVRHPERPEWGVGTVSKVEVTPVGGTPTQRITVRFPNAGIKVLNFGQSQVANEAGKDLGSSWCPPQCSRRTVLGGFFTS